MATERYNPRVAEKHWQKVWDDAKLFETPNDDPRDPYYVLEMFPYPSGRIHMGHVRNYAMGDVVARYKRAKGFNVLHPMGWDAFGMPAENAAMQNKVHPKTWTYQNIAAMRSQLKSMGLSLDWSREFATCDVEYYHRQQMLFLDFVEKGLVTRKSSKVNWDPEDMTVLANEQVIDGRGWRSGALVEQRELTQWFFKITDFNEELLSALDDLDQWPDKVRLMQRNWIGKSEGMLIRWSLDEKSRIGDESEIEVYTTRPDTLFGASFIAIAADHPLAKKAAETNAALAKFNEECRHAGTSVVALETAEKKGFDTGLRVEHPFDPSWKLPVYVANFVLMDYGTGAIFGCPAHDQRDLEFANKYGLTVVPVVMPKDADAATFQITELAYTDDGGMINSRFFTRAMKVAGHLDISEPFKGLFTQGMVVHETYKGKDGWVTPAEVKVEEADGKRRAILIETDEEIEIGSIEKMSKSKKNVVDPDDIIASYGADTARWFMLSDSPPERDVIWTEAGAEGAHRFVQRVWRLISEAAEILQTVEAAPASEGEALQISKVAHRTVKLVGEDIEKLAFNKAVARLYELVNLLSGPLQKIAAGEADKAMIAASREATNMLLAMVGPMMPHLAEECWKALNGKDLIAHQPWPGYDEALIVENDVTLPVQINGKKRGDLTIARDADQLAVEKAALALDFVKAALNGNPPKKVIIVPQRIINVVV